MTLNTVVQRSLILLASLIYLTNSQQSLESQPAAKCQTGFFYKTLPLIAQQAYISNLDQLFNGYNLQYKLQGSDDFNSSITLSNKMTLQGQQVPYIPLIGIKNYHIQKKGNTWGSTFITLNQRAERSYVYYGVINSNTSAPVVNNYISVENNTNTTCYDAVLFQSKNMIVVDCVVKLQKPNRKGQVLQNLFYYFTISNGSFIKTLKTQLYVNFSSISRRSLFLYSDLFNQHTFLLRSYYSDNIQKPYDQNTFIQVFMITQPDDPWIVEIIDRAFLKSKTLSIVDVKIYLGQIFILDKKMGVYRVYINTQQDLKFNGYYEVRGFQRFTVYSNNLDDHFQLGLANSYSALQIDWTNKQQPRLINKYSLMPGSKVSQIFLNQRFIFIQSGSTFNNITYNYTWIMNRGDRTYTKAFKVIKHNSAKNIIDLNQDKTFLIVIEQQKIMNYKIDDSNMVIKIKRTEDVLDVINTFKIIAISKDQMNAKDIKQCQILVNFTLLEDNNRTMWPIGDAPPSKYTANFPGKVQIKLHQYVFGPNITYKIRQIDHDVIKKNKVYQQQQLSIKWIRQPPFLDTDKNKTKMKFLLSQTLNYQNLSHDLMHLYLQDQENITYFITCLPQHTKQIVYCDFTEQQQFEGSINSWTSGFFYNQQKFQENHIIAYTTKKHYNKVSLIDFTKKQQLQDINLQKGFAGNASSVAITDKYLYVVLKYVKNIQIYDLQLCLSDPIFCQPICQLNYLKMYQLGVKYFSPTQVHTSVFHPNIVFIKTSDQIIVVDYNSQCRPKLLATILPVETAQIEFSFKVNKRFLIVAIASQNVIRQYNIQRLQLGDVRFTKQYPRYGFSVAKNYDLDVSDKGNCIYLTMVNEGGDYQVFVYRSGYPAVGSLYNVIDFVSFQNVLVDSTGFQIDYVSVFANQQMKIYRQYQQPLAEIFNPNISYSFFLDYSNPSSRSNLQQIDVKIINLPSLIKVNPQIKDIMKTKDLLFSGPNKVNQINDSKWWQGNVVTVQADCDSCRGDDPIVKVNNHIQHQQQLNLVPAMSQYSWSIRGGSIQSLNSVINMKHNGTVNQFVKLPFKSNQLCVTVTVGYKAEYEVSGCLSQKTVNLYLTSSISDKGFAFQAFQTAASDIYSLQAVNDLIILVDTESNPYKKSRTGGIYLYGVNLDDQIPTSLVQVQYIDGDDVGMDQLGDLYINNAELTYHDDSKSYRLYFTEISKGNFKQNNQGIFEIDFTYDSQTNSISIRSINYLKIQPLLTKLGYQLPYDASYQAVKLTNSQYAPTFKKTTDTLILTTGRFHTIQLNADYDTSGNLVDVRIARLYLRYAYYEVQNYIKYHNGLFVVSQIIPQEFGVSNQSKQLLTIYSTRANRSFSNIKLANDEEIIEERGFLGGFKINDTNLHYFDFNLTYSQEDGHSQPRVGMVLIQKFTNKIQKFTLHQNLSVVTKQMIDTQIIYIDLINDFSLQKIRILINGYAPYPQWKLITIILFSIIGGIILILGILFAIKKIRQRQGGNYEQDQIMKDSLITSQRKSFQPSSQYQNQEDSKQSRKRQKEREKQQKRQQKQRQKQRQKQQKLRQKQQKERQKQQKLRQKQIQKQRKRQSQRQRESEYESQRQTQRQRQRQRQRQKNRLKQKQKQKQRQRQRNKEIINPSFNSSNYENNSFSSFQPKNNFNDNYGNFNSNNVFNDDMDNRPSRFGERRAFRQRPQRPSRNTQSSGRQQPSSSTAVRSRRNVAIIEQ